MQDAEPTPPPQLPPVTVTRPEDLTADQLSTIPNLPTERTATALLDLLEELARQTDQEEARYVQIVGAIREHGCVGLYQVLERPGSADVTGYVVAWKGHDFDMRSFPTSAEETAKETYDAWAEEPKQDA
jgi:hypothetical protein